MGYAVNGMMKPHPAMPQFTHDHELLVVARLGDRQAMQELARRWWPRIKRWAFIELGDESLAEDACQEALIRLVRKIDTLDLERPLGGWLRTVVRNCCRSARGTEHRHQQSGSRMGTVVDLEHELDMRRGARRMLQRFAQLTPRQREALDLVDRQGFSPKEAAEHMGVESGTVRALLHQGRHALRRDIVDDLSTLVRSP